MNGRTFTAEELRARDERIVRAALAWFDFDGSYRAVETWDDEPELDYVIAEADRGGPPTHRTTTGRPTTNKYVVIPIAGQVTIYLPDDFEGDEDEAFQWAMDNLPQDFSLDNSANVQWDFYRHVLHHYHDEYHTEIVEVDDDE